MGRVGVGGGECGGGGGGVHFCVSAEASLYSFAALHG